MKKLLTIIVAILMLVSVVAVSASAYGRRQNAECKANNTSFADTDNNGVCDNRESFVKAQNNECNGNGNGLHCGKNR